MIGDSKNREIANKIAAEHLESGYESFQYEWQGSRVPESVSFPDGSKKETKYMRDGMINFKDGTDALYERIDDIYPKQPQSILIFYSKPNDIKE